PPDTSKSAFLEFGGHGYPGHQQPSPGLSHNHYPVHGLHAVGPPQHDGPFPSGASSYGRPLGYPSYHSPVSAHHPGPYLPYQHGGHGGALVTHHSLLLLFLPTFSLLFLTFFFYPFQYLIILSSLPLIF
ncbi:unnamed protein product, partial [Tetraodon nigroviridis]